MLIEENCLKKFTHLTILFDSTLEQTHKYKIINLNDFQRMSKCLKELSGCNIVNLQYKYFIYLDCLFVCLSVSNKRQNG